MDRGRKRKNRPAGSTGPLYGYDLKVPYLDFENGSGFLKYDNIYSVSQAAVIGAQVV